MSKGHIFQHFICAAVMNLPLPLCLMTMTKISFTLNLSFCEINHLQYSFRLMYIEHSIVVMSANEGLTM